MPSMCPSPNPSRTSSRPLQRDRRGAGTSLVPAPARLASPTPRAANTLLREALGRKLLLGTSAFGHGPYDRSWRIAVLRTGPPSPPLRAKTGEELATDCFHHHAVLPLQGVSFSKARSPAHRARRLGVRTGRRDVDLLFDWRRRSSWPAASSIFDAHLVARSEERRPGRAAQQRLDRAQLGDARIAGADFADRQARPAVLALVGDRAGADDRAGGETPRLRSMRDQLAEVEVHPFPSVGAAERTAVHRDQQRPMQLAIPPRPLPARQGSPPRAKADAGLDWEEAE